ncbi:MAG: glycosyltransferase [Bacteroidaceae bacterium]|nr:glycosyltransferase [Bacteroidaceae bacterium]
MERIKYVCFFGAKTTTHKRHTIQSATTKLEYIFSVLNRLGYGVDIISKSDADVDGFCFDFGESITMGNNRLKTFFSIGCRKNGLLRVSKMLNTIHMCIWMLFNLHKEDIVIAYHSPGYMSLLYWLKKIKGFTLIGEIEEIYQDVKKYNDSFCHNEYRFINCCDKYIYPTQLLNDSINKEGKPYCVIHGVYSIEESRNLSFNDGKIHVVYGGTFDPNKGGAAAAAAAAAYLPENYHVHICGFGSPEEVSSMKKHIAETQENSRATVTYDGLLVGEDYINHIQKCQIGLSTQNPEAAFNATSFPSKILVYLSNGLRVVTIRIPAIETSAVSECLFFYDQQTPKEIASAILRVSLKEGFSATEIIQRADHKFEVEIKNLIEK